MLDETTTDESTEESESTTSTEESTDDTSTSKSSEESTEESQDTDTNTDTDTDTDTDTSESQEPILTDAEKERRQDLLGDSDKEVRDLKSEHGRERKAWEDERREMLAIIKAGKQIEGQDNTSTDDDGEPEYYQPSQPFKNEDGSINMDALAEWNLHTNQKLYHALKQAEKKIEELGGDVTGIHRTAAEAKEAKEFQARYGLSDEVYENYTRIKAERGDLDAIDYLNIEKKEADGIAAAQAHRDSQRTNGGAPALNTGGAMTQTTQDGASIAQQAAKEILAIPRGDARNEAVLEVPFKYPQEVSSQILRLVVDGE